MTDTVESISKQLLDELVKPDPCDRQVFGGIEQPGLYPQMSAEEYFRDPCPEPSLSQSIATTLVTKSPAHAWLEHPRLGGKSRASTPDMINGSLIHSLLLDGGKDIVEVEAKDFRTKAAKEQKAQALAEGKVPVISEKLDHARFVAAELKKRIEDLGFPLDGQSEVPAFWRDEETGLWCRGMLDHLSESKRIYDLKTISCAHPEKCRRHMIDYGYDIQWCAYTDAQQVLDILDVPRMTFLFCETEPPFCVTPVEPLGTMKEHGESRWRRARYTWQACLAADVWPGYAKETVHVECMPWDMARELENDTNV